MDIIIDKFEKTVEKFPNKVAFYDDDNSITFLEMEKKAKRIASNIVKMGIKNSPIVVLVDKNIQVPSYYLGILYSGNFYVPIGLEQPKFRITTILNTIDPKIIVTEKQNLELIDNLNFNGKVIVADCLEEMQVDEESLMFIRERISDSEPAYIIFTSGSTGDPKGVIVPQKAVVDYICALAEIINLKNNDIMGNQSPFDYDGSIRDIYFTLFFGTTTYIIPKGYFSLPVRLFEKINEEKVTCISWAVSAISLPAEVGAFDYCIPKHLRKVMFAGSAISCKHLKTWQEKLPETTFINHYGPTETTGTCTYYKVEKTVSDEDILPIGRPFKNSKIFLLDKHGKEVKRGEIGEICVGGNGIAYGYYNNLEKTKATFVQNPLNSMYPEVIYKTGDLGYYRDDGELMFKGREDFQIKHMGHRIELGEIENTIKKLTEIKECYCVYNNEKQKIGLFYRGQIDRKVIAVYLRERLPDYMIPRKIVKIETMPIKANGKIDLEILKEMI